MPRVKAYEDIANPRFQRDLGEGHRSFKSTFLDVPADKNQDSCHAYLHEATPNRLLPTHFHVVDQFQVIYLGDGTLGAHNLAFGDVHFSRAYTPYGPIRYGASKGLGFITLRAHRDFGANYMPESRDLLEQRGDRRPWQVSAMADFTISPDKSGVAMKAIEEIKDDRGLAAFSAVMKPGARAYAPDPSKGDGQYIVVMRGSILHEGSEKKSPAIVWVESNEGPFYIVAGSEGCEAIILNFPVPGGGRPETTNRSADSKGALKRYQCVLCAFIYDEAEGCPDAGIAPGTRWADVPDTFSCPDCDARRSDFQMIEI